MPNFEQISQSAGAIATEHEIYKRGKFIKRKFPKLEEDNRKLIQAYRSTNEEVKSKRDIVPAAEWLLDNFYVIEEQVKEIGHSLPRNFYKELPTLSKGTYKGYPRVYGIAVEMVSLAEGRMDEDFILHFLGQYQLTSPLSGGELWAIPLMIRISLIQKIREITIYISTAQTERALADAWSVKLLKAMEGSKDGLQQIITEHDNTIKVMTPVYAERLLQRLRDQGADAAPIIRWVDGKLAVQRTGADEIIQIAHQQQAAYQVSMGNAVTGLRFISGLRWDELFEALSLAEQILCKDPSGIYPVMEFASRDYYRHNLECIAKKYNVSEIFTAEQVIECSKAAEKEDERFHHVGYYLIDKGKRQLKARLSKRSSEVVSASGYEDYSLLMYLGSIFILTALFMGLFLYYAYVTAPVNGCLRMLLAYAIAFIPIWSIVIGVVHWTITHILRPKHMPKLELKEGIPPEYRTMVIIPTLLTSEQRVNELIEQMEVFYLANQEPNLHFALIGDFKDGPLEETPEDAKIVETGEKAIHELNKRYGEERQDIFFYFHRHRQWNDGQKSWMGWERKRGALAEYNELLGGSTTTSYSTQIGDLSVLPNIRYVITLDADTQLPRDAAKKLIGAMIHPLNKPILNAEGTRVIEGHGLLQPRIGVAVDSAARSFFALTFSGQTGVDPYTCAVSDVYQDLFGEGIFTGKGIYDVQVFNRVLEGSIPENRVLSHDLLEGSYVRAGLVTDIELVDGYPAHYIGYAQRLHRWVRGDWQLLPWLGSSLQDRKGDKVKNPLHGIAKWKIIDNLRRSLLSPALFLLLILSFTLLPGSFLLWMGLAVATLAFPLVTDLVGSALSKYQSNYNRLRLADVFDGARSLIWQILLSFVFLAHQAYSMLDAILRTIWRVTISHKNMLEWVTAADSERRFKGGLRDFWSKMQASAIISGVFLVWVIVFHPMVWPLGVFFAMIWATAPYTAYRISLPKSKRIALLSEEQITMLRRISRKTWKYFDDFVDERDHWLPPDNYQAEPPVGVAHRTSPTNIGLLLASILTARDFGYISTLDTIERLEKTVGTMGKLDKWKGHYYNWYNTITLVPLRPLYVSTVDNGNLIGYLITINQGIEELLRRPIIGKENITGLRDILLVDCDKKTLEDQGLLNMFLGSEQISLTEWKMLLDDMKDQGRPLEKVIAMYETEMKLFLPWVPLLLKIPTPLLSERGAYREVSKKLTELLNKLNGALTLQGLIDQYHEILKSLSETIASLRREGQKAPGYAEAKNWLKELEISLAASYAAIRNFTTRCWELTRDIQEIIKNMDFHLLYDEKRELFSIGYNVEEGQLTKSYYDLLASEARQASFIAIAKGDVPQKHWFKLGRSLTLVGDQRVLLSWSGTMFEYLMPLLIMKNYDYTLLDETYTAVVKGQRQYAEQHHLPWGVSESGFYAFDLHLNYQYKAFGIPQLGLKRGLVNDMVITPYASILGLPVDPAACYKNLEMLMAEGMEGPYGLYEAMDCTPERLPKRRKSMIVKSFMAHHQGMSLLALNNYINNNRMQARFHAVPMIKATELLLQERMPKKEIYIKEFEEEEIVDLNKGRQEEIRARRTYSTAQTPIPETNLLSNGAYSVMLTNSGGGFSQYQGQAVSRWREDATRDNWGMAFYIQNLNANTYWSAAHQPVGREPESYEVAFEPDRVIYHRRDGSIETKTEIVVSPEYNGEIRRLSLTNHSESSRIMDITSYFEVVLAPFAADDAHPAFSNLFVQTEYLSSYNALLATRRPRDKKQKPLWLIHTSVVEGESIGKMQYETDRAKFIGRGRDLSNPQVLEPEFPLSDTAGNVLDPVMSIRRRIHIYPGQTRRISYITAVAETREIATAIARECQSPAAAERAFELAWTHSQVELRYLNMSAGQANLYQTIASHILYGGLKGALREEAILHNNKGQSALWAYGISGELPVALVRAGKLEHMELVKQMLTAHEYWRLKGLIVDLVLLNDYGNSYEQPVQERLRDLISISHARDMQDKPGGVFLRQAESLPQEDINLLTAVARLVLTGDGGSILNQLTSIKTSAVFEPFKPTSSMQIIDHNLPLVEDDLLFYNEIGGFSQDGSEYNIRLRGEGVTPMPWSNVIANPQMGFLITESGSGYTWWGNSREYKLTPWSNDPISDPAGEILYIRDEETGEVWNITPLPISSSSAYNIRHGQGYTVFEHNQHGLIQQETVYVPLDAPIKISEVSFKNTTDRPRKLLLTYYVEWVLGIQRSKNAPYIVTEFDETSGALLAQNHYHEEFFERIAFVTTGFDVVGYTGDRTEFIGRNGDLRNPQGMDQLRLSGRTGGAYDPCGAVQCLLEIPPGEQVEGYFILGQGANLEEVRTLIASITQMDQGKTWLSNVKDFWKEKLSTVQVKTPDPSMDLLLNGWLLYQTYACRIWARTAFYQAGGAYGFRDQLQDVMALIYSTPERIVEQIVDSAAHQFTEGDVQHWWHPPRRGVRTRITDDLLFLPYVTADYIEITGDTSILDKEAPFLVDALLNPDEHDRYNSPAVTEEKADIYEHCIRAISKSLRFGINDLPLIGGGDWNDGMDMVGIEGKGESVWLGWFLYTTLMHFIPICKLRGDQLSAEAYTVAAEKLLAAIEKNAWDGGWYRRAYFDDGTPLGSEKNEECRIDSISQSWAAISEGGRPARIKEAMRAVEHHLVCQEEGLIKLLTPPFHQARYEPGYIKGYVPGVRENGGQYTHAAVWTILAFAKMGDGDKANQLFHLINPINHTRTWIELSKYKVEPYVTAADIYAVDPHTGRGGWTWYTGSSGWMYRVGIEWLLGLKPTGSHLAIDPCIPKEWNEFRMEYRYKSSQYHIHVKNPNGVSKGVASILLDQKPVVDLRIPLLDDNSQHDVLVTMGN